MKKQSDREKLLAALKEVALISAALAPIIKVLVEH
jgi:hypothetical protein